MNAMTVKGFAEYVGIPLMTAYQIIHDGRIPTTRHAGTYVIQPSDAEAFKGCYRPYARFRITGE